jgi:hypothetical protein
MIEFLKDEKIILVHGQCADEHITKYFAVTAIFLPVGLLVR